MTGFGFTGRSRAKAWKATSSTRPRLQRRAGAGGQRPTRSMVKRWFERCSPTKRGEPRVCAMVKAPTPGEEDRRHLCRERKALTAERVRHVVSKDYYSARAYPDISRCAATGASAWKNSKPATGRAFPPHLKALVNRELDRLELLLKQIKTVEAARDALLAVQQTATPAAMLLDIRGIGPEFAAILWSEGLFRHLKTDGRSQRMRVWPRRPGKAARSIGNRECPKPATRDCEQH